MIKPAKLLDKMRQTFGQNPQNLAYLSLSLLILAQLGGICPKVWRTLSKKFVGFYLPHIRNHGYRIGLLCFIMPDTFVLIFVKTDRHPQISFLFSSGQRELCSCSAADEGPRKRNRGKGKTKGEIRWRGISLTYIYVQTGRTNQQENHRLSYN